MSASAAIAAADSSLATPEVQPSATDSTPVEAITPPAVEASIPESVSEKPKGEPPAWRWQDILENTRKSTREEAEARVRQEVESQYQWAKDVADHERDGLLTWRAAMNGDPQAVAHIKANPQALAWLKGLVTEPPQAAPDPMPDPDLQSQDGTLVYSATQMKALREWDQRQLTSTLTKSFDERLKPFEGVAKTFQQREAHAKAFTEVGSVLAEFRADPDFKTHEADVKAELAKDSRLAELADRDVKAALEIAYARVWKAKVLPGQQKKAEGETLAQLQQRAVAGTLNPANAAPTTPSSTLGNARAALLAAGGD